MAGRALFKKLSHIPHYLKPFFGFPLHFEWNSTLDWISIQSGAFSQPKKQSYTWQLWKWYHIRFCCCCSEMNYQLMNFYLRYYSLIKISFEVFILLFCDLVLVTQSYPTLSDPIDWGQPGSSVHGILQARILEWVVKPSRGFSDLNVCHFLWNVPLHYTYTLTLFFLLLS